jgi:hypothetical protein
MLAIPSLLVRAVEVIDESEELGENVAGGVAVGDTAHRQRIAFVLHAGVECRVGMERGSSALGLAVVEILRFVFVTVYCPSQQIIIVTDSI